MSFLDKEKELLSRMKEDGYSMFKGNKDEALKYVTKHVKSIIDYPANIAKERINRRLGKEDSGRENDGHSETALSYNAAVTGIIALNLLSNILGMGNIFEVNLENHLAVKKYLIDIVKEIPQGADMDTE